jgi:anhydro-N-acetylmuramic acid kinase
MRVLGFMTGTSLDGIDVAVLETDGESITKHGPYEEYALSDELRSLLKETTLKALEWKGEGAEPEIFHKATKAITDLHIKEGKDFMRSHNIDSIDLIGAHGQTVYHRRPQNGRLGFTKQLLDPQSLAKAFKVPVWSDFRSHDISQGGEGAPLAPIYHQALVRSARLLGPVVVINLGGVANITAVYDDQIIAMDTGPANGLMDQWVQAHNKGLFDKDGEGAKKGSVHLSVLEILLSHSFFNEPYPKSLDRYDFSLEPLKELSYEDGLATLDAFTRTALKMGIENCGPRPKRAILCGGGRLNAHLYQGIVSDLAPIEVLTAEEIKWRGSAIEAEAFAFLAARSELGKPISFPTTTGAPYALAGGVKTKP